MAKRHPQHPGLRKLLMTNDLPFLRTYSEWKDCITNACRIALTPSYVEARISALADPNDYRTQRFVSTWGMAHLDQVRAWFEQAREELAREKEA